MTTLDSFFVTKPEPLHPRLRDWTKRLANPDATATLEVFRPKGEWGQPEMYVQFAAMGQPTQLDNVPWEDDLNAGLIRLKVKSLNVDNEAQRFAFGLKAALRQAERHFGDGYFNAVLVKLINESDLKECREISEVLQFTYATEPFRKGGPFDNYSICHGLIADAIQGRARELTEDLGYSQDEAKRILVSALARYLDERFSVSRRRELGMV